MAKLKYRLKRVGAIDHPWCKPFWTSISGIALPSTMTSTFISSCRDCMISTIAGGTPYFHSTNHIACMLGDRIIHFSIVHKEHVDLVIVFSSLFHQLSCTENHVHAAFSLQNPLWKSSKTSSVTPCNLVGMTLANGFPITSGKVISCQLPHY